MNMGIFEISTGIRGKHIWQLREVDPPYVGMLGMILRANNGFSDIEQKWCQLANGVKIGVRWVQMIPECWFIYIYIYLYI